MVCGCTVWLTFSLLSQNKIVLISNIHNNNNVRTLIVKLDQICINLPKVSIYHHVNGVGCVAVILAIFLPMPVSLFSCLPLTFVFKHKSSMKLFRVEQGNQSIFQNYCLKGCWGNGNTHRETYSKMDTASCSDSEINLFLQTFINFVEYFVHVSECQLRYTKSSNVQLTYLTNLCHS